MDWEIADSCRFPSYGTFNIIISSLAVVLLCSPWTRLQAESTIRTHVRLGRQSRRRREDAMERIPFNDLGNVVESSKIRGEQEDDLHLLPYRFCRN